MKNIILTGLMGSGKTSVSVSLKNIFKNFDLIEIDNLIVKKEGMEINKIFETKGEAYFRKVEKEIVDKALLKQNQIISLGGGSLENNFDFESAKKNSVIFYLKADVETLYKRIKNNKDRPLLKCDNPKGKLENLLTKRENNYKKADYTIDVNDLSIEQTAKEIERIYNEAGNY